MLTKIQGKEGKKQSDEIDLRHIKDESKIDLVQSLNEDLQKYLNKY